jgi:hypothetical protein
LHFLPNKKEAFNVSLKLNAILIAKYFNISPIEVLNWSYSDMLEIMKLIEVIHEVEGEKDGK